MEAENKGKSKTIAGLIMAVIMLGLAVIVPIIIKITKIFL
jgi:hypothetical protein